jgi:hypothetical protein
VSGSLTDEQRELFEKIDLSKAARPSAGQTAGQAVNAAVADYTYLCRFDGIPDPDEATLRAAIAGASSPKA